LARIGTSCFQQLLESNVRKLSPEKWESIVSAFVQLFRTTTASQLFDPQLSVEIEQNGMAEEDGEQPSFALRTKDDPDRLAPFQKFVAPAPLEPATEKARASVGELTYTDQRRIFKQIIVKCVLQLLLIETTHGLLQNNEVYNTIPAEHLLRFMGVLDDSWKFARRFNADKDLRTALWRAGE
jgi:brefeldin A-inhibited guanine nucleotide-exchange protein